MTNVTEFEEYVRSHSMPMVDEPLDTTNQEVALVSLALAGEVGEVANHVKKSLRDGKPYLTSDYLLELGDCLHYLTRLIQGAGYTVEEIARMNIVKLNNRMKTDESFASKVLRKTGE